MSTITEEFKRQEAIKRMNLLGLSDEVIADFEDGIINMSIKGVNIPLFPIISEEIIRGNGLGNHCVYYMIQDEAGMTSVLSVSNYTTDWETEIEHIEQNVVYAYVINHSDPQFSEFGSIGIINIDGCLIRIS